MSSTILEARQNAGTVKQLGVNGQYTTSLKNSTTIEQGDQITLRNVFIDSVQEATTIEVQSDTTLTLEFIPFATLTTDMVVKVTKPVAADPQRKDNKLFCNDIYLASENVAVGAGLVELVNRSTNFLSTDQTPGAYEGVGDGFQYCATTVTNVGNDYQQITAITVHRYDKTKPWGNTTLSFYYIDENGDTVIYHHHFAELDSSLNTFTYNFPNGDGPICTKVNSFSNAAGSGHMPEGGNPDDSQAPPWNSTNPNFNMGKLNPDGGNIHPVFIGTELQANKPLFTSRAIQTSDVLTPRRVTRSITIKKGQYPPSILANVISRKFNGVIGNIDNNYAVTKFTNATPGVPVDGQLPYLYADGNPILDIGTGGFFGDLSPAGLDYNACSIDDSNIIVDVAFANPGLGDQVRLCGGCANFEIDFDNDTQTFKIPKLHTEFQTTSGTAPNIQYAEGVTIRQLGPLQDVQVAPDPNPGNPISRAGVFHTSYTYDTGCMLLTDMTSRRADGLSAGNFWTDTLGFSRSILATVGRKLAPANSYKSVGSLTDFATTRYVPTFNFLNQEQGVQRTAPLITPKILMPDGSTLLNYLYAPRASPTDRQLILTTDTNQVFSSKTLQSILAKDAFFKIVINGIPANRLHTKDSVEFVSAIVSKYYSGQSYINGFSSDSVTYVHSGAPVQLSAFDINILDSTNAPADVGPDNTLFIEIIKATPDGLN